jgi:molybdopterin molybdotransferase
MITVSEAENLILSSTLVSKEEIVDIESSMGRVLFNQVTSIRNQPPFHRVAMDGIAIDSTSKNLIYMIENIQAAGKPKLNLDNINHCIEVMTGAVLPEGCDCVIPYENIHLSKENKTATIDLKDKVKMRNIHPEASDYKEGEILLTKGTLITSPVIAVLASQGKREVSVFKQPKISVISTGTELVELNQDILPHQIHMSNSYAIASELKKFGIVSVNRVHIVDDLETTENLIRDLFKNNDILILTGGVSMGKFDYIPEVLSKLGVKKIYHKIKQKPGKPMWYGTKDDKQVFALPGNPVSCLVCLRRYVIGSLNKSMGQKPQSANGKLTQALEFKKDFTLFKPVSTSYSKNGELLLTPINSNGSGDFFSLAHSDGFVELPAQSTTFGKDEQYNFYAWHR